jgi:hypothetical protein
MMEQFVVVYIPYIMSLSYCGWWLCERKHFKSYPYVYDYPIKALFVHNHKTEKRELIEYSRIKK